MKKILSIILTVLMLTASMAMMAVPASADNTAITPDASWYDANATTLVINDAADLLAFATQLKGGNNFHGKTVELAADVDLNPGWEASETAPTNKWPNVVSVNGFWGTFDGKGHTIKGIYNDFGTIQSGIFGNFLVGKDNRISGDTYVLESIVIKNLAIVNSVQIVHGDFTGGFYGDMKDGVSNNPDAADAVYDSITFENVYNGIDLISTTLDTKNDKDSLSVNIGGFIGRCNTSGIDINFKNCVYAGNIKLDTFSHDKVGGFVGLAGNSGKTNVDVLYENCAYYGNGTTAATAFACFTAEGSKVHNIKNSIVAGVMTTTEDPMMSVWGSFFPVDSTSHSVTGSLYTLTNGSNSPKGEEVSVAPEGTTFCTHAELIGANAKTPAEGWSKTAGYAMPTALYTQFATLLDAQTPVVPDGTEVGGNNQGGENNNAGNNNNATTDTEADETTEAPETTAAEPAVEEGGCGGVIGLGAVAIVGVAAVAVARKKRD